MVDHARLDGPVQCARRPVGLEPAATQTGERLAAPAANLANGYGRADHRGSTVTLREPMTGQPLLSSRRGRLDCGWVCPTKCRAEGRQRRCEQGHLPRPGVRSAGRHRSARRSRLPPALEGPDSAAPETLDRCLERATHRSSQEPLPGRRQRSFARARIPNGAAPPRVSSTTPGHVCCAQARLRIRFAPVPEARARRRCAGRIGSCTDLRVPRRAPPSLDPARPAPARRLASSLDHRAAIASETAPSRRPRARP